MPPQASLLLFVADQDGGIGVNRTQPAAVIGTPSRTLLRRLQFFRRDDALPARLQLLEARALEDGWVATPAHLTFDAARKEFGVSAGRGRPLGTKQLFATQLLNHCARIYSLEDTHQVTITTITNILAEGAGQPSVDVLRSAVRESSATAMSELVQSKSWIASLTDRVTTASRPRKAPSAAAEGTPHLWALRNAPTYTFAGIYTALLTALGYTVKHSTMTMLAWDIAALSEGLGIAELSRNRTAGIRPHYLRNLPGTHHRRATDPDERPWPLLGFLIMKLLEPHLAADNPDHPVPAGADTTFLSVLRNHPSFADDPS